MEGHAVIALIIAAALVLVWGAVIFNRLVRNRMLMREAWSGIDVQLKRRHSLIPNLVDAVKAYGAHERRLLENVTRARSDSMKAERVTDKETQENLLSQQLKHLIAVAEAYPDLKASASFTDLQEQLVEVEEQIQYARRYYNGTVRDYNIRVESFPSNVIAGMFRFKPADFFKLACAMERAAPEVEMS